MILGDPLEMVIYS